MASAIPAALGLGGSLIGGISGKGAAKKQEKLARDQMAQQQKQFDQIWGKLTPGLDYAMETSKPFLQGASQGIADLRKFWQPLVIGDRSAIDQFLAPERSAINQGYASTVGNLARMAPRGGGRVSALAGADVRRQGAMNDLVFGARKEGAGQLKDLAALGGQLGTSTLNTAVGPLAGLLSGAANRQQGASQYLGDIYGSRSQGLGGIGQSLGGFLADLFKGGGSKSGGSPGGIGPFLQGDTGAGNSF